MVTSVIYQDLRLFLLTCKYKEMSHKSFLVPLCWRA